VKFHSVYIRLTALYVFIIMVVSLFFSVVLYRTVSTEVDAGLQRQSVQFYRQLPNGGVVIPGIDQARVDQLEQARQETLNTLIYINLAIFVIATLSGYALARRTLEPIEEAVEAQNRFTADASHELRTPLTAMRTEIEVALRGKSTAAELKELLQSNLEEIAKLETLSSSLLRLAQHDGFQRDRDWQEVHIATLVQEVTERFSKQKQGREINVVIADSLEASVQPESFAELIAILLDNAIKYSPDKSLITISARRQGNTLTIQVADEGQGIKASDLPYIFNRFYRADQSRSKSVGGYGLGLSIAKKIVDLHHGTITVASELTKKTIFTIKLPTN